MGPEAASDVRVVRVAMPEYEVAQAPAYAVLGPTLDQVVVREFPAARLALRGIFLGDHPGLSRDSFEAVLLEQGTDRYDPERRGIHHDHYERMGVQLHAVPAETRESLIGLDSGDYAAAESFFAEFARDFYESAAAERGYPLRLDVVTVYSLDALAVPPGAGTMAFSFASGTTPRGALRGIVHVLRAGEE